MIIRNFFLQVQPRLYNKITVIGNYWNAYILYQLTSKVNNLT